MKEEETLHTKFGRARINKGYYRITSSKEGNVNKFLHQLVWEDFYGKPVPDGYVIHHINGNKLDNRIENLQCIERGLHTRFHHKGSKRSEKTRRKMSKNHSKCWLDRKHLEKSKQKMSEVKKKYILWDGSIVHYDKYKMYRNKRKPNPIKCFSYRYKGYRLPIGCFHDFLTVEIINKLVKDSI